MHINSRKECMFIVLLSFHGCCHNSNRLFFLNSPQAPEYQADLGLIEIKSCFLLWVKLVEKT